MRVSDARLRQRPHDAVPGNLCKSKPFLQFRDQSEYKGKCGVCEFHKVCGGCRARAWSMDGDYMGEEPLCTYQPRKAKEAE